MGAPRPCRPIPSKTFSDLSLVDISRWPKFGVDPLSGFGETEWQKFDYIHTHTHTHIHTHIHTYRHSKISTDLGFLTLGKTFPIIISISKIWTKTIFPSDIATLRQKKIKKYTTRLPHLCNIIISFNNLKTINCQNVNFLTVCIPKLVWNMTKLI